MEFPSSSLVLRHCPLVLLVPSCSIIILRNHSGPLTVRGFQCSVHSLPLSSVLALILALTLIRFHKFITLPPPLRRSSRLLVRNAFLPHHRSLSSAPPPITVPHSRSCCPRAHCPIRRLFLFHLPMICLSFFSFLGWSSGIFLECGRICYVWGDPVPCPFDSCKFLFNSFSLSFPFDSLLLGYHSRPCSFGWRGGIPSLCSTSYLFP